MNEIEREFEQSEVERLYGDRIKNRDESKFLSGEELEKAALELLDDYIKNGSLKLPK